MKPFKAGIIQFDIRLGDVERNLATVERHSVSLAEQGVRLVLLPEMWSTGFANEHLKTLANTTPKILKHLSKMSRDLGFAIIGSLVEKAAKGVYNTAYLVDRDGSVKGVYRKVHLFSPTDERRYFKPGRKAAVSKTSLGPIGLMICYDLRFPELCRSLVLRGAKVVAVVAEWPAERKTHWEVLLKARAIENQVFILGANRCGKDANLEYAGHSRIISPTGEVLARAGKRPSTISADIDFSVLDRTRKQIPCLKERMPEAYE